MNSYDHKMSAVVSPFDETDTTQDELLIEQQKQYQKEAILESIGTRRARIEFDANFDDVMSQMTDGVERNLFINDCLNKLSKEYYLDVLLDFINRRGFIDSNPDGIVQLIKYFVYDKWLDDVALCLPEFDVSILHSAETMKKLLTESFLTIQNKIIERADLNPFIHFYYTYCPEEDGVKTLFKMTMMDLPGVISIQLVKKMIKKETV